MLWHSDQGDLCYPSCHNLGGGGGGGGGVSCAILAVWQAQSEFGLKTFLSDSY